MRCVHAPATLCLSSDRSNPIISCSPQSAGLRSGEPALSEPERGPLFDFRLPVPPPQPCHPTWRCLAKETGLPYQKLIDPYLLDCEEARESGDEMGNMVTALVESILRGGW